MTITSSTVIVDRPLKGLTRRIKTKHIDHLGNYTNYSSDVIFNLSGNVVDSEGNVLFLDLDAYVANNAVKAESQLAAREISQWEQGMRQGLDPAHIDMGGYFVHSVPEFNTWEDALSGAIAPILQTKQPDHTQALVSIADLWGRLTNKEGEAVAGKPNDVATEIQIAINADAANVAYVALIDEEGNPRG